MEAFVIPQKSFFKLDEVCELLNVKPYILRFWETEFPEIQPLLNASGQKSYTPENLQFLYEVHQLLLVQKKTIEEAKGAIRRFVPGDQPQQNQVQTELCLEPVVEKSILEKPALEKLSYKLKAILDSLDAVKVRQNWI